MEQQKTKSAKEKGLMSHERENLEAVKVFVWPWAFIFISLSIFIWWGEKETKGNW